MSLPLQLNSKLAGNNPRRVILFATIVNLDISSGGTIVCREHLRSIAASPGVIIHVYAPPSQGSGGAEELVASVGAKFHPVKFQLGWKPARSPFPFSMERTAELNWSIDFHFRKLVEEIQPDLIVLDYLFTALFMPSAFHSGVPVTLITLNREREFFADQRKLSRVPDLASESILAEWRLGRFENEVYATADQVVVLSSHDMPRNRHQAARTTVIEPMLEAYGQKWQQQSLLNIFFVGNINHFPNYAAVRWLCESFAPSFANTAPMARITIIGADPADVPHSWRRSNVDLLGCSTTEEVVRQFTSCGLFIAPIQNSFGSKIKILEALAHATPLIATAEALTGVPDAEAIPQFRLDDPVGAAKLAAELLCSSEKLQHISGVMDQIRESNLCRSRTAWPALIDQLAGRPALKRHSTLRTYLQPRQHPMADQGPLFPFVSRSCMEVGANNSVWLRSEGMNQLETVNDRPLRWTSASASLTIPINSAKLPRWLRVKLWGICPPEGTDLRICSNGIKVLSCRVLGQPFDQIVKLPKLTGCSELTLKFTSTGFQPPGDHRMLGVALESVWVGRSRWKLAVR